MKFAAVMFAIGANKRMKSHNRWHATLLLLLLSISLLLTACSAGGQEPAQEVTILTYAVLGEGRADSVRASVNKFNKAHKDVQIEVREYLNEDGRNGRDRLFAEMAAGRIPDILDMGSDADTASRLPYQVLARKGFLEDLWPYIERDPELGREGVVEAPLKAAEVNGGLYAVFGKVHIETLAGAKSLVGDRKSWTLAELQKAFASMPEDSTILAYHLDKRSVFYYIFGMSIENYVNRDTGQCFFTGETFKSSLEFVNSFPDEFTGRREEIDAEIAERVLSGRQMLEHESFGCPLDIQPMDTFFGWGGEVSFIGFPTEDGSAGSSFYINSRPIAMSSTCQDKEAAWEFIREALLPQYRDMDDMIKNHRFSFTPINRADYDMMIQCVMKRDVWGQMKVGELPQIKIHRSTREEVERFEDLFNSIETINLYDTTVYDIAYEAAGAYFTGDKTLDEVAELIQQRVSLYLNETM